MDLLLLLDGMKCCLTHLNINSKVVSWQLFTISEFMSDPIMIVWSTNNSKSNCLFTNIRNSKNQANNKLQTSSLIIKDRLKLKTLKCVYSRGHSLGYILHLECPITTKTRR